MMVRNPRSVHSEREVPGSSPAFSAGRAIPSAGIDFILISLIFEAGGGYLNFIHLCCQNDVYSVFEAPIVEQNWCQTSSWCQDSVWADLFAPLVFQGSGESGDFGADRPTEKRGTDARRGGVGKKESKKLRTAGPGKRASRTSSSACW